VVTQPYSGYHVLRTRTLLQRHREIRILRLTKFGCAGPVADLKIVSYDHVATNRCVRFANIGNLRSDRFQ
jgi:hypothetical protein